MKLLWKECIAVAWPLVLAMTGNALMMFADRLFLSRYSAVSIQAALPAGMISFIFMAFMQSVVAYSGTFVAQYSGSGARAACARVLGQGLWLSVLSLPLVLLTLPLGNALFDLAGHAPEVIEAEKAYYAALTVGNLSLPFAAALSGFFSGRGFTRLVMVSNLIGNALNIVLDPLLIWGWGFLPGLGIVGAGIATALAQFSVVGILLAAALRERHFATGFRMRVAFAWKTPLILRIIRFGVPSGGHVLLDAGTFGIFVFLTGRMDALSFAASNTALAINNLIFAPLLGMGAAASVMTGRYMGSRDPEKAAACGRICVLMGWSFVLFCVAVIGGFHEQILHAFYSPDAAYGYAEYLRTGRTLIFIFLCWAFLDTLNLTLGGALKGAGDTRFVLGWIIGTSGCFWMPLLFFVYLRGYGIVALWMTMLAYVVLAGIGLSVRFLTGRWKQMRIIEDRR